MIIYSTIYEIGDSPSIYRHLWITAVSRNEGFCMVLRVK